MEVRQNIFFLLSAHREMHITLSQLQNVQEIFCGDWERFFYADKKGLRRVGISAQKIEQFLDIRETLRPKEETDLLQKCEAYVLLYGEKGYPEPLLNIPAPPPFLFVRGEMKKSDFPAIAVVGSRKVSSYGKRAIEHIVGPVAEMGITLVSGLALGADVYAHRMAVEHGTRTICVLGNGIDTICPETNRAFGEKILQEQKGVMISEYLPHTEVRPQHFPARNRIISGLSRAVLIIEATKNSGSLITAKLALEQNREVFAVPGDIFSQNSAGTNQLILDGAHPVMSGEQILVHLGIQPKQKKQEKTSLEGIEAEILHLFGSESRMHIDDLIRKAPFSPPVVSSHVSLLEIKGVLKNLGNQVYGREQ